MRFRRSRAMKSSSQVEYFRGGSAFRQSLPPGWAFRLISAGVLFNGYPQAFSPKAVVCPWPMHQPADDFRAMTHPPPALSASAHLPMPLHLHSPLCNCFYLWHWLLHLCLCLRLRLCQCLQQCIYLRTLLLLLPRFLNADLMPIEIEAHVHERY